MNSGRYNRNVDLGTGHYENRLEADLYGAEEIGGESVKGDSRLLIKHLGSR